MNEPITVYVWFPVVVFILVASLAYGTVFLIRRWLERRRVLDIPNDRSSHSIPTHAVAVLLSSCPLWLQH